MVYGEARERRVYLDMDGVVADFAGHFRRVFQLDHRLIGAKAMWRHIHGVETFFRDIAPIPGAVEFFHQLAPAGPIMITACPAENYGRVAGQKREWAREILAPNVAVLPVIGGKNKALFMHQPGDLLIDDHGPNIEAWRMAGGVGILHRSFSETLSALQHHGFLGAASAAQFGGV